MKTKFKQIIKKCMPYVLAVSILAGSLLGLTYGTAIAVMELILTLLVPAG